MSDCPICLNDLPAEPLEQVTCPHCAVTVCNDCFESYLLSVEQDVVCCHSCEKPWSEDFVDENTYDDFRQGRLRAHRTKLLVDQEAARLPAVQDRARRYKLATSCNSKSFYIREMTASYGAPINVHSVHNNPESCWYCIRAIHCPASERAEKQAIQIAEAQELFGPGWCSGAAPSEPKQVFRACPLPSCRGFLDNEGKCGMCAKHVCLKCHDLLADEHTCDRSLEGTAQRYASHICDADAVATVRLLNRETKPCPNCHALIYKIDGCDQMWCILCQTAFSWTTGLKVDGRVHNPHYYEWMRRTRGSVPREPECADGQLRNLPQSFHGPWGTQYTGVQNMVMCFHRHVAELLDYTRPPPPNEEALNRIGIKYLIGEINKAEWARRVYIEKRAQKRLQGEYDIIHAFMSAACDILNSLDESDLPTTVRAVTDLMVYMEKALETLYGRYFYKGKGKTLIPDWIRLTNYHIGNTVTAGIGPVRRGCYVLPEQLAKYIDWLLTA